MVESIGSVLAGYGLSDDSSISEISNGLINHTYLVHDPKTYEKHILQQINRSVFPKVDELMRNLKLVNAHLKDSEVYQTPNLIPTVSGKDYFIDNKNQAWRVCEYIENSKTVDSTESPLIAQEAGKIIGQFHTLMCGLDATKLSVTLPNFHNLEWRLNQLNDAQKSSKRLGEKGSIKILNQIQELKDKFDPLVNALLPIRVTHNDTKLNNILFDKEDKAICLIDLDTLMPGQIHTDYGDALRTLANSVNENEIDTTKVHFNLALFRAFTEGFMAEMGNSLSKEENAALPLSIPFMPFIMAIRFFTDYLNGNVYYKVDYPNQNLDRTRNQLALVQSIFSQFDEISKVLNSI